MELTVKKINELLGEDIQIFYNNNFNVKKKENILSEGIIREVGGNELLSTGTNYFSTKNLILTMQLPFDNELEQKEILEAVNKFLLRAKNYRFIAAEDNKERTLIFNENYTIQGNAYIVGTKKYTNLIINGAVLISNIAGMEDFVLKLNNEEISINSLNIEVFNEMFKNNLTGKINEKINTNMEYSVDAFGRRFSITLNMPNNNSMVYDLINNPYKIKDDINLEISSNYIKINTKIKIVSINNSNVYGTKSGANMTMVEVI